MRVVPSALVRPHHCAVYPQLGQSHKEGYIDTGGEMPGFDNHVYISIRAVKEMAKLEGVDLVERDELTVALAQRDAAQARIESLEQELQEERQKVQAIDFLGSTDFIARKKRGPKPERQAA